MPTYDVPGVYIEEQTGPGVIVGVGTSTAAFIGPALRGPINTPRFITSFDDFLDEYAITLPDGRQFPFIVDPRSFYLAHAVRGFYENGGRFAYIVRVGTAAQASLPVLNGGGQEAFVIRAHPDGDTGNNIEVETQQYAVQEVTTGSATVTNVVGATVTVNVPGQFRVGDFVTTDGTNRAQINQIQGNDLILSAVLAGAVGDTLRIADVPPAQSAFRLVSTGGLHNNGAALISGDDASNPGTAVSERVVIQDVNPTTNVVTLAPTPARTTTYNLDPAAPPPRLTSARAVARGQAGVTGSSDTTVTVTASTPFRPGDVVTSDGTHRAQITQIQGNTLILNQVLAGLGTTLRLADIIPAQMSFRVADASGLFPGTVVLLRGDDADNPGTAVEEYAVIRGVDGSRFVTLDPSPARTNTYNLDVPDGAEPILIPQEFRLIVTPPPSGNGTLPAERVENLSLNPFHPRYVFNEGVIASDWIRVLEPHAPPITATFPQRLVALGGPTNLTGGGDDQPSGLTFTEYQAALDALRDIDDVNMICIPDAAMRPDRVTIQEALITHCLQLGDRFAIIDSWPGVPPSGPGSVLEQLETVRSERGFAALYYPWLEIRDPTARNGRRLLVPPSGYVAGVYARVDEQRGVHKAPANEVLRGVLGLERIITDNQQGPLNLAGVNVLRIFPGQARPVIWGARTTVDPAITDWIYVNVRRLMLFIEESIEKGIRFAVFEPNNLALWQKLKRTITEFLTRVWRDGALFGATPEEAFYVRIDEALNPPSTRALGRLFIEIGVAPVRPAEFIVVRIGLSENEAAVIES